MAISTKLQRLGPKEVSNLHGLLETAFRAIPEPPRTQKTREAPVKSGAPADTGALDPQLKAALAIDPKKLRAIGEATSSLAALGRQLPLGTHGREIAGLAISDARFEYTKRARVLESVRTIKAAVEAAGVSASSFPTAQLDAIEARLAGDLEGIAAEYGDRITMAAAPSVTALYPRAIAPKDVDTLDKAASVLGRLLADPKLEALALDAARGLDGVRLDALQKDLAAYALLADSAATALDYSKLPTGWKTLGGEFSPPIYPSTRAEYRARRYQPRLVEASLDRQLEARLALRGSLEKALKGEDAPAAVEKALVRGFAEQIGIPEATFATWKPSSAAVRDALAHEALIPLRALYDATGHLDHGYVPLNGHSPASLNTATRKLVTEIARHVSEGDFAEWRLTNPESARQLALLTNDQRAKYIEGVSIEMKTERGRVLKTREETGLDLFWFTKIGGPSHGFDMISQCLLPLLANARSGTVLVDDAAWPDSAAARSYLRLVNTADGKPMLYLEMVQSDFPYESQPVTRTELKRATIEHALAKSKAMNVPLAVFIHKYERAREILRELGAKFETEGVRFTLDPSAAVFEASDSLLAAHHTPQTEKVTTDRIPCAVVQP